MPFNRQRGIALPLVLWVVAVMLVISLSFSLLIQSRVRRTELLLNRFQAYLEAYSALQYGIQIILTGTKNATELRGPNFAPVDDNNRYYLDGTPVAIPLFDKRPEISIQDYSGLINLRSYQPLLINGLMNHFGASEETRRVFTDSLMDWIDPDSLVRLNGAEKETYEPLGYWPSNNPLLNIDEILLIRGMDEALFSKMEPFLVLGYSMGINPNTAPFDVLMAFPRMTENGAKGIMEFRKTGSIQNVTALSMIAGTNFAFYESLFDFSPGGSLIVEASSPFGENSRYVIRCHLRKRFGPSVAYETYEISRTVLPEEFGRWAPYDLTLWKEQVR